MYKKYKGEISPLPPLPFKTSTLQHKTNSNGNQNKKTKNKTKPVKCELLQKCLKGVAFIRITPMAKNIKISTYKRDFVVILYFTVHRRTVRLFLLHI